MELTTKMQSAFAVEALSGSARPGETTIGEMARDFSVSLRTLRFYEDRGLLQPRRDGTVRYYDDKDRARLSMILRGKQLGFTLTEIRDLLGDGRSTPKGCFEEQLQGDQIVSQIKHLERQRDDIARAIEKLRVTHTQLEASSA
jgi:DNA-binding transcriptional MerR regulator